VDTHESQLEVLLSVHREQNDPTDWLAIAASLPPIEPKRHSHAELRAKQNALLAAAVGQDSSLRTPTTVPEGHSLDEQAFQQATSSHASAMATWTRTRSLASRILAGDCSAFAEVLNHLDLRGDSSELCLETTFTVHSATLVECWLRVKGTDILPVETKSLTSTGKLSVKAMPKLRFHEIYQDYVCGCVLRVGREIFGTVPADAAVVTAFADIRDEETGRSSYVPVLSTIMPRSILQDLDWPHIDPSDAMDAFVRRGDVKASRKTGAFAAIAPFEATDVPSQPATHALGFAATLGQARALRDELADQTATLRSRTHTSRQ
jgi:hypothetical protein